MSRGKRYEEPKLNLKKVFAVILAIVVIIMSIVIIKNIFDKGKENKNITSKTYFSVYENNKWGVIDESGNTVITPAYQEMIIIPDKKTDVFLCTYDVNYETGEYSTKALNSKDQEIFTEYNKIEAISNYDENNNLWYEKNVLKVEKNGKWGIIDIKGKEIVKPEYEEIIAIKGIENAILLKKDENYGVVDNEGKIIVDAKYKEIISLGEDNKSGYIVKDDTGLYGIVGSFKNEILPCKYEKIEKVYGNDMYVIVQEGKQKIVNSKGEEIITDGFDKVASILKTKEKGFVYVKDEKYGIMTFSGEVTIEAQYDNLIEAKQDVFIATKEGKQGVIDISNTTKIDFNYNTITYNENGDFYIAEDESYNSNIINNNFETRLTGILIELNTEQGYLKLRQDDKYKYYNFKFEEKNVKDILKNNTLFLDKKDNKYGYVDKDGNVVVEYVYDDATDQNEYGYVAVKKDGKWGAINKNGQVVQEPIYNLDDYLIIDFIGNWHFGKDINMNYYNKE